MHLNGYNAPTLKKEAYRKEMKVNLRNNLQQFASILLTIF